MKSTVGRFVVAMLLIAVLWGGMHNSAAQQSVPDLSGHFAALKLNDVILFQGDSITDGGRQKTGDFNHNMGQSYAYLIAADLGEHLAERNLTFFNRGIDGNSVIDLARRWKSDTLDIKPNVLSIAIGVNDTLFRKPADEPLELFETTYDGLISDTLTALPSVKIVLCEPFLLPVGNTHNWPQLNDPNTFKAKMADLKQHQDVVARLARKYKLPEVMMQKAFDTACKEAPPEHWSWDGVHPTYAGHGLMAQQWKQTVDTAWPRG